MEDDAIRVGGYCFLCGVATSSEEYCYGCHEFICDACDINFDLDGDHDPEQHEDDWLLEEDDDY